MPSKIITNLTNGQEYGFRIFPRNLKRQYQTRVDRGTATATPQGGTLLSSIPEGGMVKLTENGVGVNFIVACHNYESELNGNGRTLVARNGFWPSSPRQLHSWNIDEYPGTTLDNDLNSSYLNLFDSDMKELISTTKFKYLPASSYDISTYERSIFIPSPREFGLTEDDGHSTPLDGSVLPIGSTLAVIGGSSTSYIRWTRTPYKSYEDDRFYGVVQSWGYGLKAGSEEAYVVPIFTLPATMQFNPTPNSDGSYSPL